MDAIRGVSFPVPAVRIEQDGVTLYSASVPARILAELGEVHVYNPDLKATDPKQGYQRVPSRQHAKKISSYLLDPTHRRLLPSSTLLASRSKLRFEPVGDSDLGMLHLVRPMFIVDGQHRTLGLELASEESEEIANFPVPAVILDEIDRTEEIRQFYTINKTAHGVKSDLADVLLKNLGALQDPGKIWLQTAIEVCERLNSEQGGPWHNQIKPPNSSVGVMSQKSKTESLKRIIDGVLTGVDATTVAAAVSNFWSALRHHMPDAFAEPKKYVLQKTTGVFAWNEVAAEYFRRRMMSDRDLSVARAVAELGQLGEYVDSRYWAQKKLGGTAPNYLGLGGIHILAQEIIFALPDDTSSSGPVLI